MELENLFFAELYDMAEQRTRYTADFKPVLNYRTVRGRRLLMRSAAYDISFYIELETLADGFRLRVCGGTYAEERSICFRLMKLRVLPGHLNTKVNDEGSYLLPLWAGALVDFRAREHCVNLDHIYMEQREWEKFSIMNCFGLLQKDNNWLAIIESGDFNCYARSEYNNNGINSLCAEFTLRDDPSDMISVEDRTVSYHKLPGNANYGDLALKFREYLLAERGASYLKDRMEGNPTLEYSVNAMRVKFFMAGKKPIPDGSSPVDVYATFDECCKMIDDMKAAGIAKAVITLVGWNVGGHDGAYPTHFPAEPRLGGEERLRNLIQHAKNVGYQIVPHDNATDIYRRSPDFDYECVARTKSGEPVAAGVWGGGQSYKACPQVFLRRWGSEFKRIQELGFEGHYYMDAQATVLWRCHSPQHPANEKEFALALSSITEVARGMYGAVSIEGPTTYALPYIDECATIHCPPHGDIPMARAIQPYPVPFFIVAVHGLLAYQQRWVHTYKDTQLGLLREIAFGARPCMEVNYHGGGNGGNYLESLKMVLPAYNICFNELKLQTVPFKSFAEPVPGVYDALYEDGTRLLVNTTEVQYEELAPRSWCKC
ncbi:MAG: hypothetical protein GX927_07355 [Lentisphaerae bacterium]|nr:hypothetical protein [Lentisphaerota bacterium]